MSNQVTTQDGGNDMTWQSLSCHCRHLGFDLIQSEISPFDSPTPKTEP